MNQAGNKLCSTLFKLLQVFSLDTLDDTWLSVAIDDVILIENFPNMLILVKPLMWVLKVHFP